MQNCPFRQKIHKEHSVVLKQLSRFCNTWQGRTIQPSKIDTYCNLVDYITKLHSSYVYNCMEYFTPIMREQMLQVNKTIVEDLVKKIKYFSQYSQKSAKSYLSKEKKQICQLCSNKIRQVDTRIIKQHLSDDASLRRNLLRKIYADLENENAQLFSKDQDEMFFRFLNVILVRKQELLAMQTKELNGFLFQVTKSLTDLNFLTQYTPGNTGVAGYRESYKQDLSKTITQSLKSGFDTKIHPWIQKVFESVKKQILTQKNAGNIHIGCQTDDDLDLTRKRSQYLTAGQNKRQFQQLKQQISKNTLTITDLKTKLIVLQKQKKQLQQQYAAQVYSLLLQKRQIQIKLRKTQTDFHHLKQTNDQIIEVNKRLRSQKKKTQQSLISKSNKSIKDVTTMSNKDEDGINQGKSEKSLRNMSRKKKKSPVNKLLSKRSQSSQKALFIQQKSQLVDKQKNNQLIQQPVMKKTVSEIINIKQKLQQKQQPLLQIKKPNKKSLKNLDRPLSRKQKSSQNQQKVQFKLHEQRSTPKIKQKRISINKNNKSLLQIQKSKKSITQIGDQQQQYVNQSRLMKKKSTFMKQKTTSLSTLNKTQQPQKKSYKNMKRMLSIQMGMSPIVKNSRQDKREQHIEKLKTTVEQNQQGLETVGEEGFVGDNIDDNNNISLMNNTNKSNNSSLTNAKKKVFEFIPLQNKRQYQQLKQKVTQVTTKIQTKLTQKLKSSIKHIQNQQIDMSEMGKVYGYSIFNKKMVNKEKRQKDNSKIVGGNQDNMIDNSYQPLMNDSINQVEQHENKQHTNRKTRQKGIQTNIKDINNNYNGTIKKQHSVLDNVSIKDRTGVYEKMSRQQLIPKTLTFQHYELIVRKLFGQINKQNQLLLVNGNDISLNNNMRMLYQSRASSLNHNTNNNSNDMLSSLQSSSQLNLLAKLKQTQSVKINIDAKFLQQNSKYNNKIHQYQYQQQQQSKVILNLPKLDRVGYHNQVNKLSANSNVNVTGFSSNNNNSRLHFNINTMRERLNVIKGDNTSIINDNNNDLSSNNIIDKSNSIIDKSNNNNDNKLTPQKDTQQQQSLSTTTPIHYNQSSTPILNNQSTNLTIKTSQITPLLSKPNNSPKHKQIFTQKDLYIFFDSQLTAYQYQQTYKYNIKNDQQQKQLKSIQNKLNQHQKKTIQSLYSILLQIKQKNHQIYHKISSFIKYPYQTVIHGFQFFNINKDISYQKWCHYLIKLYMLKCKKEGNNNKLTFGEFIRPFEEKLVQLIIDVNM